MCTGSVQHARTKQWTISARTHQILKCMYCKVRVTAWNSRKYRKCECTHTHAHKRSMYVYKRTICHNTLCHSCIYLSCHTCSVSILWLHCSELRNCYIHWLMSRGLLNCKITATHTSSTFLILRLSCGFGMGLWEFVRSHFHFSMVVGTFHGHHNWKQLLNSYVHTMWKEMVYRHLTVYVLHAVNNQGYFSVALKDYYSRYTPGISYRVCGSIVRGAPYTYMQLWNVISVVHIIRSYIYTHMQTYMNVL